MVLYLLERAEEVVSMSTTHQSSRHASCEELDLQQQQSNADQKKLQLNQNLNNSKPELIQIPKINITSQIEQPELTTK